MGAEIKDALKERLDRQVMMARTSNQGNPEAIFYNFRGEKGTFSVQVGVFTHSCFESHYDPEICGYADQSGMVAGIKAYFKKEGLRRIIPDEDLFKPKTVRAEEDREFQKDYDGRMRHNKPRLPRPAEV